jgi:hypothetical protein
MLIHSNLQMLHLKLQKKGFDIQMYLRCIYQAILIIHTYKVMSKQ